MIARIVSASLVGLESHTVQVEVDLRGGGPAFAIVGLPDTAVQEARERVRAGLANQGFVIPPARIVANLAPAHLRKAGPHFDLPIALALASAAGSLDRAALDGTGAVGELALDGSVRPVAGTVAMAEHAAARRWSRLLVPAANAAEAALVPGIEVVGVRGLRHAVEVLAGREAPERPEVDIEAILRAAAPAGGPDLADVRGQAAARRALEIAAAGFHSILMMGPPGGGKTMLARRLPGLLPAMTPAEAIAVTRIRSVAGLLEAGRALVAARPFRAPHHSISAAGLVGGGRTPRPGEVSLAHLGVLFLDEVCAFAPSVLDALRQPLEEGRVEVSRAAWTARFPARVLLVCAGNPCPCGFAGDPSGRCTCAPGRPEAYRARLSGPVADRIDMHVDVPRLRRDELLGDERREPTAAVRARVEAARAMARARGQSFPNGLLSPVEVRAAAGLDAAARQLLERAVDRLSLSARAHDRLLRVARTVADLAGAVDVGEEHLAEAVGFRRPGSERAAA